MGIEPIFDVKKRNSGTFVTGFWFFAIQSMGFYYFFSAEIRSWSCCTKNLASEAPNPWPPAAGPTNLRGIFGDESV